MDEKLIREKVRKELKNELADLKIKRLGGEIIQEINEEGKLCFTVNRDKSRCY